MFALERRRRELGLAMWEVDDRAGTADRSFAKILHADGPNGRQAQWQTVDEICHALFPDGFEIEIRPAAGTLQSGDDLKAALSALSIFDTRSQRYIPRAPENRLAPFAMPNEPRRRIAAAAG